MAIQSLIYKERPFLVLIFCLFLTIHGTIFLIIGLEGKGAITSTGFSGYMSIINQFILIDPTATSSDLVTLSALRLFSAIALFFMSRWGAIIAGCTMLVSVYFQYTTQLYTPYSVLLVTSCILVLILHARDFE